MCVITYPARALARNSLELAWVGMTQPLNLFGRELPAHLDDHAAILDRVRQPSDGRNDLGAPCAECLGFVVVTHAANYKGGRPRMPGVDQASQLVIVCHEGVRLINDQRRSPFLDTSEKSRRRDVRGNQGAARNQFREFEQG